MSKFIEKLDSFSRKSAPAMGFRRPAEAVQKPTMLAAVELIGKSEEDLKALSDAGAAAVIIDSAGLTASSLSKYSKSSGDIAIGLLISSAKYAGGARLMTPDIDFIVFDLGMPVKAFDGKEFETAGKILSIDLGLEAGLLRAVNDIFPAVNAVMIELRIAPLTLEQLVSCRKVADFTGQHLIARVGNSLTCVELTALRDSGVKSLVLPADTSAAELSKITSDIAGIPAVAKKKDKGSIALVPRIEMPVAAKEDEGGDDDE